MRGEKSQAGTAVSIMRLGWPEGNGAGTAAPGLPALAARAGRMGRGGHLAASPAAAATALAAGIPPVGTLKANGMAAESWRWPPR